jgi:hypothetical protein
MIQTIFNTFKTIKSTLTTIFLKQTFKIVKNCFNYIVVSKENLKELGIPSETSLSHLQIEKILNSPSQKQVYYTLLKGESDGFMDTPTEYYKKSARERIQMMIKNIKTLFFNLFILLVTFIIDNHRGFYLNSSSFISSFISSFKIKLIATFIFVLFFFDFATGLTHLTLDNPITKFHPIKVIRNGAWQFQDHHDNPTDTTHPPLLVVLLNKGSVMNTLITEFLVIDLLFSQNLSMLSAMIFFLNFLAEWNHRVIHTNLTPKHYFHNLTMWFMKRGILITPKKHYEHHQTYDVNFCTLTGWTDGLLNKLNKLFISNNSRYCVLYLIIYSYIIIPASYILLLKCI